DGSDALVDARERQLERRCGPDRPLEHAHVQAVGCKRLKARDVLAASEEARPVSARLGWLTDDASVNKRRAGARDFRADALHGSWTDSVAIDEHGPALRLAQERRHLQGKRFRDR